MPEEPDTYDLAFDPEDQPTPPPAKPAAKPPKPASAPADDLDTFELDAPEPETRDAPASRPLQRPVIDDPAPGDAPEEPRTVSPAKAMRKREDDRIRAAAELAEAEAKKKKIIFTAVGVGLGLLILIWIILKIF